MRLHSDKNTNHSLRALLTREHDHPTSADDDADADASGRGSPPWTRKYPLHQSVRRTRPLHMINYILLLSRQGERIISLNPRFD